MLTLLLTLVACDGPEGLKALKPNILVSPDVLDFGQVVEEYPLTLEAEILNGGAGVLEISNVSITGEGAGAFSVGEVPTEIPNNSDWPLQVTFVPDNPVTYTATLTIESDDPDEPTLAIALTGEGIVAPTPDIDCDPLALDFGTVPAGLSDTLWITCTNVGDDDLVVESWTQHGSGSFTLGLDPTGYVIGPGESHLLLVTYAPGNDSGESGAIFLNTNDPDEPSTELTLVGNGGGDFEYPVAIVTGPATAEPRTTITVDGSDSYDPAGWEPLTYHWNVTGPVDPVIYSLINGESAIAIQLDVAGTYRVELRVENTQGLFSAPEVYEIEVVPTEEFHVELIWNDSPDLDLHLLNSAGTMFTEPYDCNYCNPNPEWGALGTSDNPTLDLDALSGGVENINIETPADDTYRVRVHYYESNGAGDVTATVNIYLYGALTESFTRVVQRNKVWDVAEIVWPAGYVVEETSDLYTSTLRTCE